VSLIPWKREESISNRFESLQKEMNRLFDDFFGRTPTAGWSDAFPALATSETDKQVIVRAEVPGVAAEDLDVSIKNDVLTLKGHKKEERKEEKENFYRMERSFGSFVRQVTLPAPIDAAAAESRLTDGVLELRLPKVEPRSAEKAIKIAVK
jgi:HSP20 family protein